MFEVLELFDTEADESTLVDGIAALERLKAPGAKGFAGTGIASPRAGQGAGVRDAAYPGCFGMRRAIRMASHDSGA